MPACPKAYWLLGIIAARECVLLARSQCRLSIGRSAAPFGLTLPRLGGHTRIDDAGWDSLRSIPINRTLLLGSAALVSLLSVQAQGASVHIKSGPAVITSPTSLKFDVCLAGLGNQDIQATITVSGNATVNCLNPSGFLVPGLNKVPITATATATISRNEIKNGNVCFSLTANAPKTVDPLLAGCPNRNWTAQVVSVDFTSVTLVVVQGGQVVLNQTFFVNPSAEAAFAITRRSVWLKR